MKNRILKSFFIYSPMPQDTTHDSEENLLSEDTTEETPRTHIPEPAKKTSKFGLGQFQTGSKFGK